MKNQNVCAAIVTFNRKDYLIPLLDALSKQTVSINTIYIWDNHSSDGTSDLLSQKGIITVPLFEGRSVCEWRDIEIKYFYSDENTGGAGGFERVFQKAASGEHDFLWSMDDDVLPEEDCLEILLSKIDNEHKVAVPSRTDNRFTDYTSVSYNLTNPFVFRLTDRLKIVHTTELKDECTEAHTFPFEGPLFSMDVVKKIGYPDSSYFIQYDDSDYARRCLSCTKIWFVKSACLHKQIIPATDNQFTWKHYYGYRNCFIYDMKYGKNVGVRKLRPFLIMLSSYVKSKFIKRDSIRARAVRMAYKDAVSGKRGMTVKPGKLEEYLKENA